MSTGTRIIPERIIDWRAYKGGKDLLGSVDVELPKVQYMAEAIKGAGIAGELETPTTGQVKSLKTKITFRTNDGNMVGLLDCAGHDLEFRAAIQEYDAAGGKREITSHRIVVRGFPTEGDFGKLEKGGAGGSSIELELIYFKYEIAGNTILEIDKLNYKCVINGTDTLSSVREALGLI